MSRRNQMSELEEAVLAYYDDGLLTHEIAKKLDMTEAEVVYVLEKHHYIR